MAKTRSQTRQLSNDSNAKINVPKEILRVKRTDLKKKNKNARVDLKKKNNECSSHERMCHPTRANRSK